MSQREYRKFEYKEQEEAGCKIDRTHKQGDQRNPENKLPEKDTLLTNLKYSFMELSLRTSNIANTTESNIGIVLGNNIQKTTKDKAPTVIENTFLSEMNNILNDINENLSRIESEVNRI